VVFGAGQGIGREVARALASAGARVLCVDLDEGRAEAVAKEVDGLPCVADVLTSEGVEDVLARGIALHSQLGDIRTVVDIIGIAENNQLIVDVDEEWWRRLFALNLDHNFIVTRIFGKHLIEQGGGSIVHVASIAANNANPRASGYAAAKAGVVSLTKTAAAEFGPYGVRVNCVSPGVTLTPRVLEQTANLEKPYPVRELTGRHGTPGDIASGVLFLASDLARQITGQELTIDGGVTVLNQVLYSGQV
jgi:NAD(P)-dependent dehydrogenase (short-subunit alcohol dehydrogenase family)